MQSITVRSHVGEDGILRLQIPVGVKDTDLEVTITVKSQTMDELEATAQSNGWPPGFFRRTAGAWIGQPLERPPQGEHEERDELL